MTGRSWHGEHSRSKHGRRIGQNEHGTRNTVGLIKTSNAQICNIVQNGLQLTTKTCELSPE